MNRAELEGYIAEVYSTLGENPWAQSPTNTVFRHRHNRKWFAIIRGGGRALSEVGGVHPSVSFADSSREPWANSPTGVLLRQIKNHASDESRR